MAETIYSQIREENNDFFNAFIAPSPGYSFNQYETIKRAQLYYNSKFEDGNTYLGREKLFFNIVTPPCDVATKMLDIDTKNIRLWPLNPKSDFSTYLLEKELKVWLKDSEFGEILNQIAEELPVYGSVVVEKTKKGAEVVDIRRLILDPSVDKIKNSRFITTIHYMTPTQLRETSWENKDIAIERFGSTKAESPFEDLRGDVNQQVSTPYVKVYKRYGEVPAWWLGSGGDEMVKSVFIVAGADEQEQNSEGQPVGELGVILFKGEWKKEYPYQDFHYAREKGRWLGRGVVEQLFDTQVRINELKNQKRISMEISSIHLFQTADKTFVKNVLTDLESGDLLTSVNGITPVANEERNLQAFDSEESSYLSQADKLTFSYEAVRGETAPSSTPLGVVQIANAQASSVFAFKRENFALGIRDFFNELVLPQLMRDLTKEHIMRFTGSPQELMKLDNMGSELYANEFIKSRILNGHNITAEEVDAAKRKFVSEHKKLGQNRFVKLKDAFYDDVQFEFDFIIDNEQADPQIMASNLQKVIGDLASNPAILQDPRLKLLYFKFAEKIGVSTAELDLADDQANQQQQAVQQQQLQQQPQQQQQLQQPQA